MLYRSGKNNDYTVIRQKNYAVSFYINGVFTKIHNLVNFLSRDKRVIDPFSLTPEKRQSVLELYRSFKESDRDINYIYSGYQDGSLLIADYDRLQVLMPLSVPGTRPHYAQNQRSRAVFPIEKSKQKNG